MATVIIPNSTPVIVVYECPDCGQMFDAGTLMHQHADGEWVKTSDLIQYHQFKRWFQKEQRIEIENNPQEP